MSQLFTSGGQSIRVSTSSNSPPSEYSGFISFRIDWFGLLSIPGTLKSLTLQFETVSSLVLSLLNGPTHTSIHGYWKNHSFDYMFTFRHKGVVICISEVIDVSPNNLDSSLCFIQPGISHDVLCIQVKEAG